MKILFIHANYLKWKVKEKAIKNAEKIEKKEDEVKEALISFISVEREDGNDIERISSLTCKNIEEIFKKVKAERIVLYPYAHLSKNLADPHIAVEILNRIFELLKDKYEVHKVPFGWYKSFEISAKGHPLSELSREISLKEEISKALKRESKIRSRWYILTPEGNLNEIKVNNGKIEGFDFSNYENLEKFAKYEIAKSRVDKKMPIHVKLMQELELIDYENASDPGNFRYYPKGKLIKSLLEDFITKEMIDYGAMEIESPIMYDYHHKALKSYLNRFPARQYTINTPNKKVFLRFAACFGQFLMAKDSIISYKNMPFRLYELTRYSFRVEQRGELSGLRRLRAFTMPDCHAFCKSIDEAKEELMRRFELSWKVQSEIGFKIPDDFELALRVTKDFWNENKDFIKNIVRRWEKPALLEMWDEQFTYFTFKYEWNFVDNNEKAAALNTDQIDTENAKNFNITFIDEKGEEKYPIILHLSPSGAIERVIYALLEKTYRESINEGRKMQLPLWLSPTQVRLIPLSEKFLNYCENLHREFDRNSIRCDIDDRNLPVSRKIRDAEKEWIPYILVIGEKEMRGEFNVRIRNHGEKEMKLEEIIKEIKEEVNRMPFKKLSLPHLISRRVKFRG